MKNIVLKVLLTAALCTGCQSRPTSARLQSTAYAVLAEHHFAPPVFTAGRDAAIAAMASRPLSDYAAETVCMRLQRDGRASVEITSYQYMFSDWAIVGRLFDHGRCQQEAAEIERAVEKRLKAP
jgi:hypothetical protein